MQLSQQEYEELVVFYASYGYDITKLDVDDKSASAHLIIAQIMVENSPLEADKLYDLVTNGKLREFFDTSLYPADKFYQSQEIIRGLNSQIDISQYWNSSDYNSAQMHQICLGLKDKIDVTFYNNLKKLTAEEMEIVRLALERTKSSQDECNSF